VETEISIAIDRVESCSWLPLTQQDSHDYYAFQSIKSDRLLASMTSIVMAYKAGQLQKSIDAEIANGTDLSECRKALEHVGPVA
jgi:hypothetical protein